jgi:hypothetical protein
MRFAIAAVLVLHGLAHLVGFLVPWQLIRPAAASYSTTLFAGQLDVGAAGIRAVGLLWLLALAPFLIAAAGVVARAPWWTTMAFWAALASMALCLVSWPEARIGAVVNLALLAWLTFGRSQGWVPV